MARIYLAARYGRREELCRYAEELHRMGHTITSRWLAGTHDSTVGSASADERRRWAQEDWEDLSSADIVIAFTEGPDGSSGRGRGGRHVEFGAALARGQRIIVIGPAENVFYCLPQIERYERWTDLSLSREFLHVT